MLDQTKIAKGSIMIDEKNVFSSLKKIILGLAFDLGMADANEFESGKDLSDFSLDYLSDWQEDFEDCLKDVVAATNVVDANINAEDMESAMTELAVMRARLMLMDHVISGLVEDIERIVVVYNKSH